MAYKKIGIASLMPGGAFDWLQEPNKESMTRQEAVAPTPQQAIAQTSQSAPLQDNSRRQPYRATGAGGFTTYKDRNGKIQMVGVPGATILPGQGNRSSDVETEAQQQGKFHINGLGAADGTVTQPEQTEIPRRTHQTAGGAMPVGRSTAPVATNGYTYDQAAEGMKRFNGNVDLYHRPVVSSEAMNNAGYNIPAGNTATVYSMQRGIRDKSGRVREVLYTPITATGEVMSQKDIDAYIDGLDGSDDILAADKAGKGMIIHLDANPNGNDGQDLHLMQEAYGRGPQQTKQTQPGQVITPQQAKDAVDKVAQGIQQRADARKQEELARNRHQRSQVDETKADPEEVKALQGSLGLDARGDNGVSGYDDILAMMRANTLNEGDMARRQHSREVVTGLGDLVSSIANLWATTKGAPNSYDNSKGMTATSQSRYDRELARRKAQNEQILNYYRVKKAAEDDERIRKYREDIDAREQRRLDEAERHNKEMERLAAEKEQNNKEAKAEEQERKNKDSENKRNNDNKRANAYVAGQNKKGKGSTKKSSKSSSSNTPPSRRRGNSNGNNTRPSKRK